MKISIVIPNWNGRELLEKNLPEVIKAYENKENRIKEIIIVDDASTDKSVELVKEKFPKVRLIKHKINRGFSATVNTGARSSKGDLIALLNTDVSPRKDFLEKIILHFKDKNVFGVSLHEEGYGWARGYFKEGFIVHEPGSESKKAHTTFWVSGGSGVFKRSIWMKLKGLDEKLLSPFYWEDLDISYRALKRGYQLWWEPTARVVHEHEAIMSRLPKKYVGGIRERNQLLVIWKNITSPNLFRKHIIGLFRRMARHPGYLRVVLAALPKMKVVLKARKKERKESKISDEAIFAKFK